MICKWCCIEALQKAEALATGWAIHPPASVCLSTTSLLLFCCLLWVAWWAVALVFPDRTFSTIMCYFETSAEQQHPHTGQSKGQRRHLEKNTQSFKFGTMVPGIQQQHSMIRRLPNVVLQLPATRRDTYVVLLCACVVVSRQTTAGWVWSWGAGQKNTPGNRAEETPLLERVHSREYKPERERAYVCLCFLDPTLDPRPSTLLFTADRYNIRFIVELGSICPPYSFNPFKRGFVGLRSCRYAKYVYRLSVTVLLCVVFRVHQEYIYKLQQ